MLAKDGNKDVRYLAAKNPNIPPEILAMLAKDGDEYVRQWVASNTNTPPEILAMLAKDGDEDVRYCAAQNPNILNLLQGKQAQKNNTLSKFSKKYKKKQDEEETYSSVLRRLHKSNNTEALECFLSTFKNVFDQLVLCGESDPSEKALPIALFVLCREYGEV